MNKQELIEEIKGLRYHNASNRPWVDRGLVLDLVEQLDEPQKVVVSEEEAKFLETFDFNCESDVTTALYFVSRTGWGYYLRDNDGVDLKDLSEGLRGLENRKRLIKAILDGYTVEEKRYLVKMKGMQKDCVALKKNKDGGYWYLSDTYPYGSTVNFHTRKELEEAGFGWVFDCPGIEIEEVEE